MPRLQMMRILPVIGFAAILSGCVTTGSLEALCSGTARLEADHAAALAGEASDKAVMTGQAYIATVAAGCGR
jgi:hypothetical protein